MNDGDFAGVILWQAIRFLLLFCLTCGVLFIGEPDLHDAVISAVLEISDE